MKKVLSILSSFILSSTVASSIISCKVDDSDKWLILMPEGWINSDPVDKIWKADILKYSLAKGTVQGCNLFFYMKNNDLKEYNSLNGSCQNYWEPYLTGQLGYGPSAPGF